MWFDTHWYDVSAAVEEPREIQWEAGVFTHLVFSVHGTSRLHPRR